MEVYGAYLEGFNAEAAALQQVVFGRAPARRPGPPPARRPGPPPAHRHRKPVPAPPPGLLLKRYKVLLSRFRRASAARDQRLAAQILGQIRAVWASLTGRDRRRVPPPGRFRLPGLRLALRRPEARRAEAAIEAEIDDILDEDDSFGRAPRPVLRRRKRRRTRPGGAFPKGRGAPFPPPRMAGEEVF